MQKQKRTPRAPRYIVPNHEQALITIGSKRIQATLNILSSTGGTVRLRSRLPSGTFADISMKTGHGICAAAIELLQPKDGSEQAFRFVSMAPVARARLNDGLYKMRQEGFALEKTPRDYFRSLARVFSRRAAS